MRRTDSSPRATPWWLRLAEYAKPHRLGLLVILLLMCAEAAIAAVRPWPLKLIIDVVLTKRPLPAGAAWLRLLPGVAPSPAASPIPLLAWLATFTIVVFVFTRTAIGLRGYVTIGVQRGIVQTVRADLLDRLQQLSLKFYARHTVGDLLRRVMEDSNCVNNLVINIGISRLAVLVRGAIMFVVMWRLDHTLAVVVLFAGLPLGLISRLLNREMTDRAIEEQRLGGEMTALAEQTLTVLPLVKGFDQEEAGDYRFANLSRRSLQATLRLTMSQLKFEFSTSSIRVGCNAAVMLIGGFDVLDGSLSVGSLLIFLAYFNSLVDPLEGLAYTSVGFASARAGARRIFEVLDADERVREMPGAKALPSPAPAHVRMEGVTFGYEAGRPVLHNLSLDVRPGEMVALVGPTGAGKSTLVSLIPRFFDPWEGRVTIHDTDIREVQIRSLRSQIALVLQDPFVLPLSIAENIAYGRPDATSADVEAAAHAANAHVFIERLPQGFDTVVGERGVTLSGGERQRLAIARALLKDAPILILDEPTSALDVGTEAYVMAALKRLMRGRTVLVIAHRLSTVRRADRIVVLDAGRVVETGTHEELLAAGGVYRAFHATQFTPAASSAARA